MDLVEYTIQAKTSDGNNKGSTDASIFIKLVGNEGLVASEWLELDNWWRDDFEKGRTDTFEIKAKDVQTPMCIGLRMDKKKFDDGWYCEHISVKHKSSGKQTEFKVFDWLLSELWIVADEESLPQKESCRFIEDVRKREVERNRHLYQWYPRPVPGGRGWGLPRFCNAELKTKVPPLFYQSDAQVKNYEGTKAGVIRTVKMEVFKGYIGFGTNFDDFDDYWNPLKDLDLPLDKPKHFSNWQSDEEFGRQTINGCNPLSLQQIKKLPSGLNITGEEMEGLLDEDMTLDKAFALRRMYMVDYREVFKGLPENTRPLSGEKLYSSKPVTIFYVNNSKDLVPVVIQLEEDDPEKVFTPNDTKEDWMLAKMYAKTADVTIHEWYFHFLQTHSVMEPVAVSMFRNLSSRHPVHKLLRDHLITLPYINTDGREDLFVPDSFLNELFTYNINDTLMRSFKLFQYDDLVIPKKLKSLGLNNPNELPNYFYRDDALQLWYAIEAFVKSILLVFYKNNQDVIEDKELQSWTSDVAVQGIGWQDGDKKGFPLNINSVDELVEYVTTIIFTCSVQHAAVNFGQFESYKFTPNSPVAMRLPSHRRGEGSKERILKSLPDSFMTFLQLAISYILSQYAIDTVFLGDYKHEYFSNEAVLLAKKNFKQELNKIEETIMKRNESLEFPFTFLLPSKIPACTDV